MDHCGDCKFFNGGPRLQQADCHGLPPDARGSRPTVGRQTPACSLFKRAKKAR